MNVLKSDVFCAQKTFLKPQKSMQVIWNQIGVDKTKFTPEERRVLYETSRSDNDDEDAFFQCNVCENIILAGHRFHCTDCADYDLCKHCYKDKKNAHFGNSHTFIEIKD